jgi:hypothetical protein
VVVVEVLVVVVVVGKLVSATVTVPAVATTVPEYPSVLNDKISV